VTDDKIILAIASLSLRAIDDREMTERKAKERKIAKKRKKTEIAKR